MMMVQTRSITEIENWKTTNPFLSVAVPIPDVIFPFKVSIGLKDESWIAG